MDSKIKIGIVDDQQLFRKGVASLCNSFNNVSVVLEAGDGNELLKMIPELQELPDILLLDLNMPGMDGMETTKRLKRTFPSIKIIILTIYNEDRFILHLLESGANAYLFKDCEPVEFEKAIRAVYNDGYYFSEFILKVLHESSQKPRKNISGENPFVDITAREKDVLLLICEEYTTQEIADKLFISARTAEGHRNNLLVKTGCKNTAGLVIFAIKNKLFMPAF